MATRLVPGSLALALALLAASGAGAQPALPHLEKRGAVTQLIVDGSPFLALAGEVGNSSGEPEYLRPYWPKLRALNLNTLLVPVYWELMEPQEGRFDFSQLDGVIEDARANQMRLVLLWFASWKNSISSYAPGWLKADPRRFPRAAATGGRRLDILSPLAAANRDADQRAFAALMRHLRRLDGVRRTVIMVQVENEIGMIPEARDHSAIADQAYAGPVPAGLLDHLRRHADTLAPELAALWGARGRPAAGSWEQVFGPGRATEEIFTAWHFATYVQAVAAAGKGEYPLPMFVNAALVRPGYLPGMYPSAGPLPHLIDVWRAGAPAIDFLSPDIYFPNFAEWCRRYTRSGNPLFIPEAQWGGDGPVNVFYAVGQHAALGFGPFAIESINERAGALLAASYGLLASLAPTLAAEQPRGSVAGLLPESAEQRQAQELPLGGYLLRVTYERGPGPSLAEGGAGAPAAAPAPATLPAGGLVIATGPDEFVFAGMGVTVTFASAGSDAPVGILSAEEGRFEKGAWRHVRWLNGDQTHQGRHLRLESGRFSLQRIKLYRY